MRGQLLSIRRLWLIIGLLLSSQVFSVNLFNAALYRPLIADRRAFLPGDVLTVMVLETSNAQTSTDLSSGKEIKTALEASYNQNKHVIGLGLHGDGKSRAKTGRNGKIKAALTVSIHEDLGQGRYLIQGKQLITINGEQQTILLSGVIRQEDISAQNTILSTRLADAKISYEGAGPVSNSQRYNHLYKFLSFVGLV